jgi:hypothetical protein
MSFRQLEYLVGELPEYPQRLTIGSGKLRYESHSNLSNPGSLGIGVFERTLSEKELEALASNFSPAAFAALPDHRGQVLSGDRWRRIRLIVEDQTLDKLVGTKLPVDVSMQRTIDRLERLVDDVQQHPVSVLRMNLRDAAVDRSGVFSGILELSGSGPQRVPFRTPLTLVDAPQGSLDVYWWPYRPDLSRSNVETTVITEVAKVSDGGGLGAFRIRARLTNVPAGAFALQVRYSNLAPRWDNSDVVVGQLFSTPVGMTVK